MALSYITSVFENVFGRSEEPAQPLAPARMENSTAVCTVQPGADIPEELRWHMGPRVCPTTMNAYVHQRGEAKIKNKSWVCCSPGGGQTIDGASTTTLAQSDLFYSNSPRREGQANLFLRGSASTEVQNLAATDSLRGNGTIGVYTRAEDTMYGTEAQQTPDNVTTMPYASSKPGMAAANW
jgi:hypothetical protein